MTCHNKTVDHWPSRLILVKQIHTIPINAKSVYTKVSIFISNYREEAFGIRPLLAALNSYTFICAFQAGFYTETHLFVIFVKFGVLKHVGQNGGGGPSGFQLPRTETE